MTQTRRRPARAPAPGTTRGTRQPRVAAPASADGAQMLLLTGVVLGVAVLALVASVMSVNSQLGALPEATDPAADNRFFTIRSALHAFFYDFDEDELPAVVEAEINGFLAQHTDISIQRGEVVRIHIPVLGEANDECSLLTNVPDCSGTYNNVWTWDGSLKITAPTVFDGTSDGIIRNGGDEVLAVIVQIEFHGEGFSLTETVVYPA